MEASQPRILTMTEGAEFFGISTHQLFRLMGTGRIPYYKMGKEVRFVSSELMQVVLP